LAGAAGGALASAAEEDPVATGSASADSADDDPGVTGAVMAFATDINSEVTGRAVATAAEIDSIAMGLALIAVLKHKTEPIATVLLVSARTNIGDIQTAIQSGSAQDPGQNLTGFGVSPSISWVPQIPTETGPGLAGEGVVLEAVLNALDEQGEPAVAGHSPTERMLIKFPASRTGS